MNDLVYPDPSPLVVYYLARLTKYELKFRTQYVTAYEGNGVQYQITIKCTPACNCKANGGVPS